MNKMLIFFFLILSIWATTTAGNEPGFPQDKQKQIDVRFIESKKNDPGIYWGEGVATIKNLDIGVAMEKSKERALSSLSLKIEANVETDVSQFITERSVSAGNSFSADIKEEFNKKVKVYTKVALTDIKEKYIIDFPVKGNCFYLVWVSKTEYEKKVNEDLKSKKAAIITAVENGNIAFVQRDYLIAANHWILAGEYLDSFFGNLPLHDDYDGDGRTEDANAYLNNRIKNFFGNIELSFIGGKITYDADGTLTNRPLVRAIYEDAEGQKHPIPNLPLEADFITGGGRIRGDIKSSEYGEATISMTIDASNPSTAINVKIDRKAIQGLNNFRLPQLAEAKLNINKVKTMALALAFFNKNSRNAPEGLLNDIKTNLLSNGYLTVEVTINGRQVQSGDISRAADSNADYLLAVILTTSGTGTVGGYANMFVSNAGGLITLYKLPRGDQIAAENINTAKGYGTSGKAAGWDAYGKIKKSVMDRIRQIIGRGL